jgi:uncharacterized protein
MWKALSEWLKPDLLVSQISDIPTELLVQWQVKGIILDVDNTLLPKKASEPEQTVQAWIKTIKEQFKIILLSNNIPSKIRRAADPLELEYIAWTIKPWSCYFRKAFKKLQLNGTEVCVIGDQVFTDILGGKLLGTKTILVHAIDLGHEMLWTRIMRYFERKVMAVWTNNP